MIRNKIYATNLTRKDVAHLGNTRDGVDFYRSGTTGASFVTGIYEPRDAVALVVDKSVDTSWAFYLAALTTGKPVRKLREIKARQLESH